MQLQKTLSPQAQAVLDAVLETAPASADDIAAIAIRTAIDQLVPFAEIGPQVNLDSRREAMEWGIKHSAQHIRARLLTIAAELGTQTPAISGAETTNALEAQETTAPARNKVDKRDPECVANWPDCWDGGYNPKCCRFPKSCSCGGDL